LDSILKNDNQDEQNRDLQRQDSKVYYQSVESSQGSKWLKKAYAIFKQAKGTWIGIGSFIFIASLLPVLSTVVIILMPLLVGGLMIGCNKTSSDSPMKFEYLFSGFKQGFQPLLVLSLINLVVLILVILLTLEISTWFGLDLSLLVPQNIESGETEELIAWMQSIDPALFLRTFLMGMLIFLTLMLPVFMAFWFAPALVCLRLVAPVNALKMSFTGCTKNKTAFFLYGLVAIGYMLMFFFALTLIASFAAPLMLPVSIVGYIAGFSISLISIYTSYLDVFPDHDINNSDNDSVNESPNDGNMLA